jgi:hypothetical protein
MPTAVLPLLALKATAGGPSVHMAIAVAFAVSVTPLRTEALRLLTPCINGCDGLVMLAVLLPSCWDVELYGVYPPVIHLPARFHVPRVSQANVPTITTPPPSS